MRSTHSRTTSTEGGKCTHSCTAAASSAAAAHGIVRTLLQRRAVNGHTATSMEGGRCTVSAAGATAAAVIGTVMALLQRPHAATSKPGGAGRHGAAAVGTLLCSVTCGAQPLPCAAVLPP